MDKIPFYPKLEGKMAEKGVSKQDMATAIHMNYSHFTEKSKGKYGGFNILQANEICKVLGCTLNDIFLP